MKSTLYTHTVFSTGRGWEKKRCAENTECEAGTDAAVVYRLALEKEPREPAITGSPKKACHSRTSPA